jgi:hypothetical protein
VFGTAEFLGFLMSGGTLMKMSFPSALHGSPNQRTVDMTEETELYQTPVLVEVGDFAEVTLGDGSWGWDDADLCWFLGC